MNSRTWGILNCKFNEPDCNMVGSRGFASKGPGVYKKESLETIPYQVKELRGGSRRWINKHYFLVTKCFKQARQIIFAINFGLG
jgi:hypothetical protein